jgi:thiol-disulfide isomerase/thioredoxin
METSVASIESAKFGTRKWLAIGLGVVFAWVAFLATRGQQGPNAPMLEGTGLVAPANFEWVLRDLDDAPVDFARYRGRPILLNLWATWCPPCLEEMPTLARLAANPQLKEKGVVVICVSLDEKPETLRQFVKGMDWGMTILRATSTPPVFQTDGIPATFLIAPDGRVAASQVGSAQWDHPSVVAFLENLAVPPR